MIEDVGSGCDCHSFGIQSKIRAKGGILFTSQTKSCFDVQLLALEKASFSTVCFGEEFGFAKCFKCSFFGSGQMADNVIEEQITSNDFNLSAAKLKFEDEMYMLFGIVKFSKKS